MDFLSPVPIFPCVPKDDFNRANGDPGTDYTVAFGSSGVKPLIDTNQLKSGTGTSSNSGMFYDIATFANFEIAITMPTLPVTHQYIQWRAKNVARNNVPTSAWSGYFLDIVLPDTFVVNKYDGTTVVQIGASFFKTFAANDAIGVRGVGDLIQLWRRPAAQTNFEWLTDFQDSTYADGYCGLEIDDATVRLDDLYVGAYSNVRFDSSRHPKFGRFIAKRNA